MEFKDLSPEDQQAILQRIERARKEAPQLMREGRYADAFDLVYFSALIDPECMRIAMDITLQKEGIHLLRPEQIELLRQHADEKRPLAQYLYGYWLWYNHETPADMDTVVDLMTAASNWGIGNASLVLSLIYKRGELARVEKEESEEYYKKAGSQEFNQLWFRSAIEDRIYGRRGQQADPQTTISVLRDDIIGLPKDTDLRWQTEREKELESEAARQAPPFVWQLLYECYDELGIAWA
ncbi:MAG: hypothetical protein K6C30_06345, partial [Bacteroidaceae bacterium]|nr:hypothetical protein [Bacteroidaceae bacterium]